MLKFNRTEFRAGSVYDFMPVIPSREMREVTLLSFTGDKITFDDTKYSLDGALSLSLTVAATGGNIAGGETFTVTIYRKVGSTYYVIGNVTCTVPAVSNGKVYTVAFSDPNMYVPKGTHFAVSASTSVAVDSGVTATFAVDIDSAVSLAANGFVPTTYSYRTNEISPLDMRDTSVTIADSTAVNNTTYYFPAGSTSLTSCWDTFSKNASGGKGRRISLSGKAVLAEAKTCTITVWASDDPNATVASKTWVQRYFHDNDGSVVNSKTLTGGAGGSTETFMLTLTEFSARYLAIKVVTNDNTTFSAWMSVGY